jgi:cytochrome c oxidase subunit 3
MKWGMVEWFIISYVLGAVFVAGQVWEYAILISEGVTLSSDSYGSAFYITTGFHALHVTGGLIAFLFVIGRTFAAKKFGHKEATAAIVVSYYWHFVDVVWIALFLIIYVLK